MLRAAAWNLSFLRAAQCASGNSAWRIAWPRRPGPASRRRIGRSFFARSLEAAIAFDRGIVHRHMLASIKHVGHAGMLEPVQVLNST